MFTTFRRINVYSGSPRLIPRYPHCLAVSPRTSTYKHLTSYSRPDDAGHIQKSPNEAIFFIENVLPVHLGWLPRIPYLDPTIATLKRLKLLGVKKSPLPGPMTIVEQALPPDLRSRVTKVVPRSAEGGAFVKVSHDSEATDSDLVEKLTEHLKNNPVKPWFSPLRAVRVSLVLGRPWIEDLHRFPSSRLKVEFLPTCPESGATELTQEALYSLARRYGKLSDIIPQPPESKVTPRYALLDFTNTGYAIMAKNCLHGFQISEAEGGGKAGTLLKMSYERKIKGHWIRDWIFGHPRIVIPVIAAILATVTVIIFDPIRTFFIKTRISPPLHVKDNNIWLWIQKQVTKANQLFSFSSAQHPGSTGLKAVWEDRQDDIQQIQNWLAEGTDTFIVVHGARGSGKKEFVIDGVLKPYKTKLVIDCKPIQEARGDGSTIAAAATEVGYRPLFSSMNGFSSVIDAAAQSAIGTKAGLSETLDTQLGNIWQNTAKALRQVALDGRRKDDKDAHMSDDEWLQAHPERRPVVVIDNFLHKGQDNQMIYEKLADWAAALTYSNIARVIFLTSDISYSKTLSRSLPNQVFHETSFSDCRPEVAKRFVLGQIGADEGSQKLKNDEKFITELDSCIETLGGRLTDLEFLSRMITRGESPNEAVQHIISESAAEILKIFVVDAASSTRSWSPEQAWYLIARLGSSEAESVKYSDILLTDMFKKNGEETINALEQAELVSVTRKNGRPSLIKPGKPVLAATFKQLIGDQVLRSRLDLRILEKLIAGENASIKKYEEELQVLGLIPRQPSEASERTRWLFKKLVDSQRKIEGYEKQSAELKEVLRREF